jgi:hypothetical protein
VPDPRRARLTDDRERPVAPSISVVVVGYDMARELPRTLRTLAPDYQCVDRDEYEVVVVDNGSPQPLDGSMLAAFPGRLRVERIDPAPRSPARAANLGLELATGELVGLIVDGARMASPGLLATARMGAQLAVCPVIATPGYHLGDVRHMDAAESGYDQSAEDALLGTVDWEHDGYRLFEISTLAASTGRGWFGPMGESSALFLRRETWKELGGLDEAFALPGGGLVNHDLYCRACALEGAQLVVLLGEGTFHQYHGGAATSRRLTWDEMHDEYVAIRGERHRPPQNRPVYVGGIPPAALPHLERSVQLAGERARRRQG